MDVDFGRTAADYRRHRRGFPERLWREVEERGVVFEGRCVLDLGTGTGNLARALARRGARVTGLDRAPELLDAARDADRDDGVQVHYVLGRAEDTGLEANAWDVVCAGQCWWWFDAAAAAREARRLLVPGGAVLLASLDWLPLEGNVVQATEALIESFNPEWELGGGDGEHPEWIDDLRRAGFERIESLSFDVTEPYDHAGWRGRIRASAGVGASLPAADVERFDAVLADLLAQRYTREPLDVAHRVFAVIAREPA